MFVAIQAKNNHPKGGKMIDKIKSIFKSVTISDHEKIYIEWDRQRARALTPSDRAEIDAIFARHM